MPFRIVSTLAATVFICLCITLLILPDIIYWLFSISGNDLGDFMSKRAAMLFLGLALVCYLSRNTSSPEVIKIVSASIGISMSALALVGVYELTMGMAGLGILLAIGTEVIFGILFYQCWKAQ